jgi:hypothetical protein
LDGLPVADPRKRPEKDEGTDFPHVSAILAPHTLDRVAAWQDLGGRFHHDSRFNAPSSSPLTIRVANLAESYYLSLIYLSWQSVIVGDPLCALKP